MEKQIKEHSIVLNSKQKNGIAKHIEPFREFTLSTEFEEFQKDRLSHSDYFQKKLPKVVDGLTSEDVLTIISMLWAYVWWTNKPYVANQLVSENGIDNLKKALKLLLNKSLPVSSRYDKFLSKIKHLGPAAITEMLCYIEPDICGIWNQQARKALKTLDIENIVDLRKYRISGEEYGVYNELLKAISHELQSHGFKNVDLLFVDFFLYEINQQKPEMTLLPGVEEIRQISGSHDEIKDLTAEIGGMLGFDTDVEVQIEHGAIVDVIWRAKIGNLGIVEYVFEVQKSGSIDSVILNLQKAKSRSTVQKIVVISDEKQLEKIRNECSGLPEEFRRSLSFWDISEVIQVSTSLRSAMNSINRLGLISKLD